MATTTATEPQAFSIRCDRTQNREQHCGRLARVPAYYMRVGLALFVSAYGRCECGSTLIAARRVN